MRILCVAWLKIRVIFNLSYLLISFRNAGSHLCFRFFIYTYIANSMKVSLLTVADSPLDSFTLKNSRDRNKSQRSCNVNPPPGAGLEIIRARKRCEVFMTLECMTSVSQGWTRSASFYFSSAAKCGPPLHAPLPPYTQACTSRTHARTHAHTHRHTPCSYSVVTKRSGTARWRLQWNTVRHDSGDGCSMR